MELHKINSNPIEKRMESQNFRMFQQIKVIVSIFMKKIENGRHKCF